jgi:uncharacterized membrane protein YecN with MAPEG domain
MRLMTAGIGRVGGEPVTTGKRRADKRKHAPRALLAVLAVGALGSGVAWYFLVGAAIEFGRVARRGQSEAWLFTGAATLGAVVCLMLLFVLAARVLAALGLVSEYKPRRSAGKRAR